MMRSAGGFSQVTFAARGLIHHSQSICKDFNYSDQYGGKWQTWWLQNTCSYHRFYIHSYNKTYAEIWSC